MFGQKAKKIIQLSSDVESFKSLHKKELSAKESLQDFVRDIRVALGAKENENLFDAIAQFKWDVQNLTTELTLLKQDYEAVQIRLNEAVVANLASNRVQPDKTKVKRVVKRKKG